MWDPDEVARMCYERYTALPRRGKPEEGREWTQLAAVIQVTRCPDTHTGGCTRSRSTVQYSVDRVHKQQLQHIMKIIP